MSNVSIKICLNLTVTAHSIFRVSDFDLPRWRSGWCAEGMCGGEVLLLKGLDQVGAVLRVDTPKRTFPIGL